MACCFSHCAQECSVVIKVFQRQLLHSASAVEDLQDLHRQTGDKRARNATPPPLPSAPPTAAPPPIHSPKK